MGLGTPRALNLGNPPGSGPNERVVSIPKSCSGLQGLLQTSAHRDPSAALRAARALSRWRTHLHPFCRLWERDLCVMTFVCECVWSVTGRDGPRAGGRVAI